MLDRGRINYGLNPKQLLILIKHIPSIKNSIYCGLAFGLSLLLLNWRSHPVNSAPIELQADVNNTDEQSARQSEPFGTKGQKHWYIQGAAATTLDRNESDPRRFGLVGAGISKFLFDRHSINLELNTIYFSQPDDDALGLNLALLMRWHFVRQTDWSLYIDGGAGVMGTTSDVPSAGASFNFTPQVGGGGTIRLNQRQRLMLGLRWHHISHADLFGANPGRDSIIGYVGLKLPR